MLLEDIDTAGLVRNKPEKEDDGPVEEGVDRRGGRAGGRRMRRS